MLVNIYALYWSVKKCICESITYVFDAWIAIINEGNDVESYTRVDGF